VTLSQALEEAERYYALGTISSGFPRLDQALAGGFRPGETVVIGGRPGAGKSLYAMHILTAAAKAGHKVAMLSLEMTPASLSQRMLSRESGVPFAALRRSDGSALKMPGVIAAKERLLQLERKIKIINPGLQYDDIVRSIRGLASAGYKMVAIDYIQQIETKMREKRSDELSSVTGGLKHLAIMSGITILEVAQIRRAYQGAADKPPAMSDLKDSGSIEQDARIIILLWREEKRQQNDNWTLTALVVKQNDGDSGLTIHYDWHKHILDLAERPMGRVYEDNGYGRNDWSDINLR
jgi:replicative DNA helicase